MKISSKTQPKCVLKGFVHPCHMYFIDSGRMRTGVKANKIRTLKEGITKQDSTKGITVREDFSQLFGH